MQKLSKNLKTNAHFLASGIELLLSLEFKRLPKNIQDAFDERLNFSFQILCLALVAVGYVFHIVMAILEYNLPFLVPFWTFIAFSHGFSLVYLIGLSIFYSHLSLNAVRTSLTLCFIFGFAHYIYLTSELIIAGDSMTLTAFGLSYVYILAIGLLAAIPFAGLVSNGCAALVVWILILRLVFLTPDPLFGIAVTTIAVGVTYSLKGLIWVLNVHYVVLDIHQKERIIATERALINRDLDLARQIQESNSPPDVVYWNNAKITCLMHKHNVVGGDWAGIHKDQAGSLNIVVADAMGKGLQAALVIHAVQSLWAQAVSSRFPLDPERWLRSLNAALFHMGQNATHFVTMGFVQLTPTQCTYWSAGHVPMFLMTNSQEPNLRSLLPAGSPLGIHKDLLISCRHLPTMDISWIMLGTDGVFAKGSRHSGREIVHLKKTFQSDQKHFLSRLPADDDKTIIFMEMDYASAPRLRKAG